MAQAKDGNTVNDVDALFEELFVQCETADRLSDELCSKLEKLSAKERQKLVSRRKNDFTPLFITARRGVVDIVSYLLAKCEAIVDQFCKYYGEKKERLQTTPLVEAQNVDVARCLLKHGAKYKSTALRLHICSLRLDVAEFLFSQGANINDELTDEYKTCLDYAENDPQKCELFLKYGANVNAQNNCQKTPLHKAVEAGQLWKVEQLLKYRADTTLKNRHGDDVLRLACLHGNEDIFKYLMDNVKYSSNVRANAYELLGAIYVSKEEPLFTAKAIEHWRTALRIRQNGGQFLERELNDEPLIKNMSEFLTEDDLNKLTISVPSMLLQTVLIIHRILGYKHPVTYEILSSFFDTFIDNEDIKNAFNIMMSINEIYVKSDGFIGHISRYASEITRLMFNDFVRCQGGYILGHPEDVLTTVGILWSNMMDPGAREDVPLAIVMPLYILDSLLKSEDQIKMLKTFVTRMVRKNYCNRSGHSLLHLIVSLDGTRNRMDKNIRLPVIELLLECGHKVDDLDLFGSTPLHLEASDGCDLDVVNCLLEHGAHIDRINVKGIRPSQLLDTVPGFNTFKYITLKCLAARIVVDHKVPYKHLKFPALNAFIKMH